MPDLPADSPVRAAPAGRAGALAALAALVLGTALSWAAPLAGLLAAGRQVSDYLAFPPRTEQVAHAAFAWGAFALYALPFLAALGLLAAAARRVLPASPARPDGTRETKRRRYPWWGIAGVLLLAAGWVLAWRGGLVPPEWRRHTFAVIWLGYILAMNALVWRRTGRSLLTHRSRWFLALFPVSAAFWWLFEYLNQFVDNWYYEGVAAQGDWAYFAQATLPFATVLPGVASTWSWLRTFARVEAMTLPRLACGAGFAWAALALGLACLAAIGVWPEALFSMLWLAPLLVIGALQRLLGGETLFAPLARGDWRPVLQPALAALVCGLLWELWNYGSLAKWHYSVPYVQRFRIFEMPLLGYAGYLPFGLECALVMDLVARVLERRALWPLDPTGQTAGQAADQATN